MNPPQGPDPQLCLILPQIPPMVLAGVVGKLALSFSTVGVLEELGEGPGVPVLSLSPTDSTVVVGWSGAGLANPYTELAMLGRNKESVKTLDT